MGSEPKYTAVWNMRGRRILCAFYFAELSIDRLTTRSVELTHGNDGVLGSISHTFFQQKNKNKKKIGPVD